MMRSAHIVAAIAVLTVGAFAGGSPAANESFAGNRPLSSFVSHGPVKVTTTVSQTSARVVEPIELTVEVDAPQAVHVELPQIGDHLGDFEVRHVARFRDIPVADAAGTRRNVLKATLDTLKAGDLELPPVTVRCGNASEASSWKSLSTKPITVHITSVLEGRAEPTEFRDIKGTVDISVAPPQSYAWLKWTGGGLAAAAAMATLFLLMRRRRPTPTAWALAYLADIENIEVRDADQAEAIIHELVEVVREFIELEFDMPTAARTSSELLAAASRRAELGSVARENLLSLAALADDVKFACYQVGAHAVATALEKARTVVQECTASQASSAKGAA